VIVSSAEAVRVVAAYRGSQSVNLYNRSMRKYHTSVRGEGDSFGGGRC
jgi:hypothetical protein